MPVGGAVGFKDLKDQVSEIMSAHHLREDDAFVVWFLRAFVLDDEVTAKAALTDDSNERAIDAVYIDDSARVVHIVQGKFHGQIGKHTDGLSQVQQFTDWAASLYDSQPNFQAAIAGIAPIAAKKLRAARDRLIDRTGYRLVMYWVSTGKASKPTITQSTGALRRVGSAGGRRGRFEYIGGTRVLEILHDYLYGVAPVVPLLELPVSSDIVRTKDPKTGIVLRTFQMKGDDLAHLVDIADVRLFALNIRGYLRDTRVNKNMKQTLGKEPQNFLYFNNGVTFVCDNATQEDPDASDVLTLENPQVINGQQTTRVLHEMDRKISAKASILVRVISIPRAGQTDTRHQTLISKVVQATNWQNSIKLSDLKANDVRQVLIERGLRRQGNYFYARKTEPKRDTRAKIGKGVIIIPRITLAQAVAGCRVESLPDSRIRSPVRRVLR